jgi:allantoinase
VLTIRGERVVLPEGVRPAAILVRDGRIIRVGAYHEQAPAIPVLDAGPLVIMPGLVDTHVHVNEPGRTAWEGFETGTKAAAAGGVTTVVDMPLNSVPATTDVAAFEAKTRAARGRCCVDVGFWGGVVPGNAAHLEPLARAGVLGFKCFLSPSGVDEFGDVSETHLREALPLLAQLGLPLLVHAELPSELLPPDPAADRRDHAAWLRTRPPRAETAAIELLINLAREFNARIHVVHLATGQALDALRAARAEAVRISAETCPHYLTFNTDGIPAGATAFKCAPPIRGPKEQDALWQGLASGDISLVASDHSPAPPAMKCLEQGDFFDAWGGIASLQLGLSAVWTGASTRGFALTDVSRWMAQEPAALAGLGRSKGRIAVGGDADLVFFAPEEEFVVDPAALHHRHPLTPYAGMRLRGVVHQTLLRGQVIYEEGRFDAPAGELQFAKIAGQ